MLIILSLFTDEQEKRLFADLYERYRYDCIHTAMKICGNMAMSEDALHEAFLSAAKHKDKYLSLDGSDFRRLIVTIVKNKVLNMIKKDKHIADTPVEDFSETLSSDDEPPDDMLASLEASRRLREYLSRIDENSRIILQMKYIQGLSYKEIASALNVKLKTVEVRVARAKEKVRKLYRTEEVSNEQQY